MAQRSKRMRNKKTQKQGRSKRGGVNPGIFGVALLYFASLVKNADNQALSSIKTPQIQLVSREQLKGMFDSIEMSDESKSALNTKIPLYNFIIDNDGNQITASGFLDAIDAPQSYLFLAGLGPNTMRVIDDLENRVLVYEEPYSARQGSLPLGHEIIYVNQGEKIQSVFGGVPGGLMPVPRWVDPKVTEEDLQKTLEKTLSAAMLPPSKQIGTVTESPNIQMLPDSFSSGGSRKKRPKTKRRSKRY